MSVTSDAETPPLAGLLKIFLRHPRLLIGLPALGFFLGVAMVLGFRRHQAEALFTPANSNQSAQGVGGIAQQLGLPVNLPGDNESVDFYRALLLSRDLQVDAVRTTYRFAAWPGGNDTLSGTLMDLYRVKGASERERVQKAYRILRGSTLTGVDQRSSIIALRVSSRWPELSEQITKRLLELVNTFNLEKRQTRARAERVFLEARVKESVADLEAAEEEQKRFLERNRAWQGDPELVYAMQRITRRVDQSNQIYSSVNRLYDQAKIDEVRDTPVITVVQSPEGTTRPLQRLRSGAGLGMFLGGLIGVGIVLMVEYAAGERAANPGAYQELQELIRRPFRRRPQS